MSRQAEFLSLAGVKVKTKYKPHSLGPDTCSVLSSLEEEGASGPEVQFVPFP